MLYKHTQVGYLMIYVLAVVILLFGFILTQGDMPMFTLIVMAIVVVILTSFSTLTVIVDDQYLRIKFGYGLFGKKFELSKMASVKIAKHRWYYGWGIRFCPSPKMWTYNVSGFDVVEIIDKDGRMYRIGTDEPKKLREHIALAIR